MAHLRTQIRNAVKTALTGLATTGANVYASRVWPVRAGIMPGLLIYTPAEAKEVATMGGADRTIERTTDLYVEAYIEATSALEDTIDQIELEVEEALAGSAAVDALVHDLAPVSMQSQLSGEGEKQNAVCRMQFSVKYLAKQNDLENLD